MENYQLKVLPQIAHVGELSPSKKRSFSYEGRCLSVSMVPMSWARIARLGDTGFILSGRGHFLDAHALREPERSEVAQWAMDEGLLEFKKVATLHTLDEETEEWLCFEFDSMKKAEAEAEEMEGSEFRLGEKTTHIATDKLAKAADFPNSTNLTSDLSFDLALIEYASRNLDVDGIWWDETHDVEALSAPRGAIFPDRVACFSRKPAGWADLARFENDYLEGENDLQLSTMRF